ncbi:MAG TPA: histidinol dehydrogenase [Planctomycetales bacterium]|jgi:histidinol dehydrogenase|nr:histidinol dehydrogenase [Planctomycetales bacterium]
MPSLKLRRIDCASGDAAVQLTALRTQLSAGGNVVSARGRELTEKVFGEALPPVRVVERVCEDVRARGADALFHYTEQFDRVRLDAQNLRVTRAEMSLAHAAADPAFLETVRRVQKNVWSFQAGLLHRDAVMTVTGLHELRVRYRPLRRVGVMIPGGAAAYPSTLLMTVCPARAAGVPELAVVMPPTPTGAYNRDMLAVCHELGVTEVYRVGGAQAVAALAYGVEGMPAVDMIVGPGNLFVALAKRHVFGQVAIDCIAGPSEVVVLADASARPDFVASDMLAQAEHAPGASVLVTWHAPLVDAVAAALEKQLEGLSRADLTRESLEQFGALVLARGENEAVEIVNKIAPEHLQIATANAEKLCERIHNAGAIFLGPYTPVAVGDYAAGPSHVLPTGGSARWASGLSANDFLRRSSVMSFTRDGLARMADDVRLLAQREGLTAHTASVDVRLGP